MSISNLISSIKEVLKNFRDSDSTSKAYSLDWSKNGWGLPECSSNIDVIVS